MFTYNWWPSQPLNSSTLPALFVVLAGVPFGIEEVVRGMESTLDEAKEILASEDEGMVVA